MFVHIKSILKKVNPWHFLWLAIIASEILTFVLSTLTGLMLWGKVSQDVLIIGAVDAFVVPLTVAPVIIYFFIRQTSKLTRINEQLQKEISKRKRLEEKFRILSHTDELTGLHNRRGFFTLAEEQLKIAKRHKKEIFLLYADVDNLKDINDAFGHKEGNLALKEVASILKACYRESDIIARMGGDEFAVISVEASMDNVDIITERFQTTIDIRNSKSNRKYLLSASYGVARFDPQAPCTIHELMSKADKLMYKMKKQKKICSS